MTEKHTGRCEGADEHPHAARRLSEELGDAVPPVRLVSDHSLAEGAYRIERRDDTVVVIGGPVSGVINGVERLLRERDRQPAVGDQPLTSTPALPYRALWTWDHSTDWTIDAPGAQDTGAFSPYNRQPDTFLSDFKRLVDFASRIGINAIIVYGLLRESHGGVEAAAELCRYATERGVRILAGVGINAYGGIYWEGEHRYNLANWLRRRPDLAARSEQPLGFTIADYGYLSFARSDYLAIACPSRDENVRYHEEAVAWLVETLDVGGVTFEAGDYGACSCGVCLKNGDSFERRRRIAAQYERLFEIVRNSSKTTSRWSYYEVYTDNILDEATRKSIRSLPDRAVYQYTFNRSYWPRLREAVEQRTLKSLPHSHNVLRTHMGSQWNRERYTYVARDFAAMAHIADRAGMHGATVFGEVSAYHPPNEFNYLAFARFTWNPMLEWEEFERTEIHPLLGGSEATRRFTALLNILNQADEPGKLETALTETTSIRRDASAAAGRRWLWLEERLARRLYATRDI